jgi:hypothetical protein
MNVRAERIDGNDGVRKRRRSLDLGMVDCHLASVCLRSLSVGVGEVAGEVRERVSDGTELSTENPASPAT